MGFSTIQIRPTRIQAAIAGCLLALAFGVVRADPLPSWNDGLAKEAIVSFVAAATDKDGPGFVAPADRVASFDQDGTLWVERPMYAQEAFALERVRALAPGHTEWRSTHPYRAVVANDEAGIAEFSKLDWWRIIGATHAGMTNDAFLDTARKWLAAAVHPRYGRVYTDLAYQPMVEVMEYLRANGFKVYVVTGGAQDFVRLYSERVFGVPPENVIGSSLTLRYEYQDGKPVLMRIKKPMSIGEGARKVIGIELAVGKRPSAAFGNSEGDREMLEWTGAGSGARLVMLVQHDDAEREYAYGMAGSPRHRDADHRHDTIAAEAARRGWIVISMKNDWKRIFAFEP